MGWQPNCFPSHIRNRMPRRARRKAAAPPTVLMLLTNAYDPDPRVRQEALGLIRMGCRVRLLAWDRDLKAKPRECQEGVEIERVFLSSAHGRGTTQLLFYALLYLKMLWRGLWISFDILHCHDFDTLPLGFILGKLKRKPIAYDAHESFVDMLQGNVHPRVCRVLMAFENFLIRRIDLLITVGEKLRQSFADRGAQRSVVVGNWKDLTEYERTDEQKQTIRRNLGIPSDAVVVCCITQLLKNRMIEELIEAVQPYADVYVMIAGKGALEPLVRQRAAENPRVIYLGFIHASQVPAYTCASDVIYCGFDPAMPNFRFAAPNKLFEGLAAGKPLIAPDLGEIGDVIRRGECGIVLPDCSVTAIRQAIDSMRNPALRRMWTRNSQQLGRTEMNWNKGQQVLFEEYSRFWPELKRSNGQSQESSAIEAGKFPSSNELSPATALAAGRKDH